MFYRVVTQIGDYRKLLSCLNAVDIEAKKPWSLPYMCHVLE